MTILLLSVGAVTAAALLVWHEVGRQRHVGFHLLEQYEQLLSKAREDREREIERERERELEELENQKREEEAVEAEPE